MLIVHDFPVECGLYISESHHNTGIMAIKGPAAPYADDHLLC